MLKIQELDGLKIKGAVTINVYNGEVLVHNDFISNLVVQNGKNIIANMIANKPIGKLANIAIGAGSTKPALFDKMLAAEVYRQPIMETIVEGNVATFYATFPKNEATGVIAEAAIYNEDDVLFSRVTFPPYFKKDEDQIVIIWAITIG